MLALASSEHAVAIFLILHHHPEHAMSRSKAQCQDCAAEKMLHVLPVATVYSNLKARKK